MAPRGGWCWPDCPSAGSRFARCSTCASAAWRPRCWSLRAVCYAASAVTLSWAWRQSPIRSCNRSSIGATLLLGHWLVLASVVSYARFVVLDAQGLITVRRRAAAKSAPRRPKRPSRLPQPHRRRGEVGVRRSFPRPEYSRQTLQTGEDAGRLQPLGRRQPAGTRALRTRRRRRRVVGRRSQAEQVRPQAAAKAQDQGRAA